MWTRDEVYICAFLLALREGVGIVRVFVFEGTWRMMDDGRRQLCDLALLVSCSAAQWLFCSVMIFQITRDFSTSNTFFLAWRVPSLFKGRVSSMGSRVQIQIITYPSHLLLFVCLFVFLHDNTWTRSPL